MDKATRQKIADTIQEYSAQPYTGTNIIFNIIKEAGYRLIDLDKLKPLSDEEIHKALLKDCAVFTNYFNEYRAVSQATVDKIKKLLGG